jgi:hypothetical protein
MIRGILLLAMLAQTPEFDVASVKPAAPLVAAGTLNGACGWQDRNLRARSFR